MNSSSTPLPHSAPVLRIRLFGSPMVVTENGVVAAFVSAKAAAVVYYVAATGRAHNRTVLATLLWPDASQSRSLKNIRDVVANLRTFLDPHLAITRTSVGLDPDVDCRVDVHHFQHLLDEAQTTPSEKIKLFSDAVALYRGEFLEGVYLDDAPDAEAWMREERSRYEKLVQQALYELTEACIAEARYMEAINYATRRLAMEPLAEETHRQLMVVYNETGQQALALAQYEQCCSILLDELGTEPAPETTALFDSMMLFGSKSVQPDSGDTDTDVGEEAVTRPSLAPLVGREHELAEIETRLSATESRLITLTGLGGVGKTLLALHALHRYGCRYADGAYFVSLDSLESLDEFFSAIRVAMSAAIDLPFVPGERADVHLANYLRNKEVLLVLDGFETAQNWSPADVGAQFIGRILQAAPGLRLLVTSREPLHLRAEQVIDITGLDVPPDPASLSYRTDLHDLAGHDAVRLFLRNAQRANVRFARFATLLDGALVSTDDSSTDEEPKDVSAPSLQSELDRTDLADLQAIAHICRLVGGLPLAIELAAGWVQTLSCSEIVIEIENNIDFLQTEHRDTPSRHRSVRAVFDHTWARLSPPEREILRKLVVFRGGFARDAARSVADASPTLLSALSHKSLVRRGDGNRYYMHELLRQYVLEHEPPSPVHQAATAAQHAEYYVSLLSGGVVDTEFPGAVVAVREIEQEIENVRAAWQWAIRNRHLELIQQGVPGLFMFYHYRNWYEEGEAMFQRTAVALAPSADPQLRAQLNTRRAIFAWRLGHLQEARRLLDESDELLGRIPDVLEQARCLYALAAVATAQGMYGQAYAQALQSLDLYQTLTAPARQAQVLSLLGEILLQRGEYERAKEHLQSALALARPHHFTHIEAESLRHLGRIFWNQGDYTSARLQYERAVTLYCLDDRRDLLGEAAVRNELGFMAWSQGGGSEAARQHQAALSIYLQVGDRKGEAETLRHLGRLAEKQKDFAAASSHYEQALQIARTIGDRQTEGDVLTELGFLAYHQDQFEAASSHFRQSHHIHQESGHRRGEGLALACLGLIHVLWMQHEQARQYSQAALEVAQAIGDGPIRGYALAHLGHALAGLERWPEAEAAYTNAVELRRSLSDHDRALEPLAGMAYVALAQGNPDQAARLVDELLDALEFNSLERLLFPAWVCWVCCRVLSQRQDPRTAPVREALLKHLQAHASSDNTFSAPMYEHLASSIE